MRLARGATVELRSAVLVYRDDIVALSASEADFEDTAEQGTTVAADRVRHRARTWARGRGAIFPIHPDATTIRRDVLRLGRTELLTHESIARRRRRQGCFDHSPGP